MNAWPRLRIHIVAFDEWLGLRTGIPVLLVDAASAERRRVWESNSSLCSLLCRLICKVFLESPDLVSQGSADHDPLGSRVSSSLREIASEGRSFLDDSGVIDFRMNCWHPHDRPSDLIVHVTEFVLIDILNSADEREDLDSLLNDAPQKDRSDIVRGERICERPERLILPIRVPVADFSFFEFFVFRGFLLLSFIAGFFLNRVSSCIPDFFSHVSWSTPREANTLTSSPREPS